MGKGKYSTDLCRELACAAADPGLIMPHRPRLYEPGDLLDLDFTTVWPEAAGHGRFRVQKFVGGGFAGQVYRCVTEAVQLPAGTPPFALRPGDICAAKLFIPPSAAKRRFRDCLYWIAFQAPFSAQVNSAACRAGLLWQWLCRVAWRLETGTADGVADVYGSFFDPTLGSYGEIREWVEGRTWRLECDARLGARRRWRTVELSETGSPEYVAKRRFMWRFVRTLHRMGAIELARQYEWSTLKSQPNVLKRAGHDSDPSGGLCAVDFRAGLALLPFLPMSPGDIRLIAEGVRRGSWVQFDRADLGRLHAYAAEHAAECPDLTPACRALDGYDRAYRRAMPDISHQGWRLLTDASLRLDVRKGLAEGLLASGIVDEAFASRLAVRPVRFALFQVLIVVPILGAFLRRMWGHAGFRRHVWCQLSDWAYLCRESRAAMADTLAEWHRTGRTNEQRTRRLAERPVRFWVERSTLGWLPWVGLHRGLTDPAHVMARIREAFAFLRSFWSDSAFRERWLAHEVEEGYADGMLTSTERETILGQLKDPYIITYLKAVAVHFAMMPVTHVVAGVVGAIVVAKVLIAGGDWASASLAFGAVVVFFQVIPISPGSVCRGLYVVGLMLRDREFRNYAIAAPLAFLKYIGYLSFPLQMVTTYPELSRFMASRWATGAVHVVPVFGEKGALLEHWVFDTFFNAPMQLGRWARRHLAEVLSFWMLAGVALVCLLQKGCGADFSSRRGLNVLLVIVAVFVFPRWMFYPLLSRRREARRGV